jgi:hypothetical protein
MQAPVRRLAKALLIGLAALVGLFGLLQLIPYGRTHANPPVIKEPPWDSPRTRELAVRACFNCHSNETTWPWYANVAPMSWVVEFDVAVARDVLNFSEWNRPYEMAPYCGQSVRTGNMPTVKYRLAHEEAQLTPQEIADLAAGLDNMFSDRR